MLAEGPESSDVCAESSLRARVEALSDDAIVPIGPSSGSVKSIVQFGVMLISTFCCTTLALLLAWAIIPAVVFGWVSTAIESGSMAPSIERGDIVSFRTDVSQPLGAGTVILFNPDDGGRSIVHRIVSTDAEGGTYVTKGDGNTIEDSAPVPFPGVKGVGTFLVPLVGYPLLWFTEGAYLQLVLLVLGAASAIGPAMKVGLSSNGEALEDTKVGSLVALAMTSGADPGSLLPVGLVDRVNQDSTMAS